MASPQFPMERPPDEQMEEARRAMPEMEKRALRTLSEHQRLFRRFMRQVLRPVIDLDDEPIAKLGNPLPPNRRRLWD